MSPVKVAKSDLARNRSPQVAPSVYEQVIRENNAFGLDLYKRVGTEYAGKNLFFSAYSVSSAFAMLLPGARGETANEIARALRFTVPADQLHPAMNKLSLDIESRARAGGQGTDGQGFRLNMNNSFWGEQTTNWERPYLDVLATHYDAGVNLVDFQGNPDAARRTINTWTEEKTERRIQELLPDGSIRSLTRFVLVNTVYFNAAWVRPFDAATLEFTDATGQKRNVAAIKRTAMDFRYTSTPEADVVGVPYEGGALEFTMVVPKDLAAFESTLSEPVLSSLWIKLETKYVDLTMPKFRIEGPSISIADALKSLGVTRAFTGEADLSGMAREPLFVSNVFHQAFVKLNEKGTEAAAATAIVGERTSAPIDQPIKVEVNKPYLFFVRDLPTGAVLFSGRMLSPEYRD